jgi:hypothetical protein
VPDLAQDCRIVQAVLALASLARIGLRDLFDWSVLGTGLCAAVGLSDLDRRPGEHE